MSGLHLENEHGYGRFGTVGAVDEALRRIWNEGDLLATAAELRAAHTAGEPIRLMGRTFLTKGVLHMLGLDVADRPLDGAVVSLDDWARPAFAGWRTAACHREPTAPRLLQASSPTSSSKGESMIRPAPGLLLRVGSAVYPDPWLHVRAYRRGAHPDMSTGSGGGNRFRT